MRHHILTFRYFQSNIYNARFVGNYKASKLFALLFYEKYQLPMGIPMNIIIEHNALCISGCADILSGRWSWYTKNHKASTKGNGPPETMNASHNDLVTWSSHSFKESN